MIETDMPTGKLIVGLSGPLLILIILIIVLLLIKADYEHDSDMMNKLTRFVLICCMGLIGWDLAGRWLNCFGGGKGDNNQVHEKIEVVENRGGDNQDEKEEIIELKRKLEKQERIIEKLVENK